MAVTEAHPRVHVHVMVEGTPLHEFEDDDEEATANTVHKYIECQSGAEYALRCQVSKPRRGCTLLLSVYCDGKWAAGTYLELNKCKDGVVEGVVTGRSYSQGGKWFLEKFCFSELKIDTSGALNITDALMKSLKNVGEIKMTIHRVKFLKKSRDESVTKSPASLNDVPEKALKGRALSHISSFRPATATASLASTDCKYIDGPNKPMATFKFKYRSKAALQSLLIIPRSPSPIPLEERDVDSLTPEESRELILRLRAQKNSPARIKREGFKREHSEERKKTKREDGDADEVSIVSTKRRRLPARADTNGVETIDLT